MPNATEALVTELDGVLCDDMLPTQLQALMRSLIGGRRLFLPGFRIGTTPNMSLRPPTASEKISLWLHSRTKVPEEIRLALQEDERDVYINTDRPDQKDWIQATLESIAEMNREALVVRGAYFRTESLDPVTAKAQRLQTFRKYYPGGVTVVDSRADQLFPVARANVNDENMRFYLVNNWSTNLRLTGVDLREYPNVTRVNSILEVLGRRNRPTPLRAA